MSFPVVTQNLLKVSRSVGQRLESTTHEYIIQLEKGLVVMPSRAGVNQPNVRMQNLNLSTAPKECVTFSLAVRAEVSKHEQARTPILPSIPQGERFIGDEACNNDHIIPWTCTKCSNLLQGVKVFLIDPQGIRHKEPST
jgi:hypothetical protein